MEKEKEKKVVEEVSKEPSEKVTALEAETEPIEEPSEEKPDPIEGLSAKVDSIGTAIADLAASMKAGFESMQDFAIAGGAAITDEAAGAVDDDSSDYVLLDDLDLTI